MKPYQNAGEINSTHSKTSDELYKSADDGTSNSTLVLKTDNFEVAPVESPELSIKEQPISAVSYVSYRHKSLPIKNDGTLDYDGEIFYY